VRLEVSEAFHSSLMDAVVEELSAFADRVPCGAMEKGFVSSLTGQVADHTELATGRYWGRQARETVQFGRALVTLAAQGCTAYVEMGPGTTLLGLGQQCVGASEAVWVASLRRQRGEWQQVLESVGQLWVRGVAVDWEGFERPYARRRLPLPTSPFARQRFWVDTSKPAPVAASDVWNSICATGHHQAAYAPLDLGVADYSGKWAALQEVTLGAIVRCLRDVGLFRQPDETLTIEQALRKGRITSAYARLVARGLARLADSGVLERCGPESFRSLTALPEPQLKPLFERASVLCKNEPGIFEYTIACADRLSDIVTGRLSPLELLFPAGGFERAEQLYQHSPLARYLHTIAGAVIRQISQSTPTDYQFRVLEVGGGTGAITASLLPVLPAERTTYTFTDISPLFLTKTAEKFAAFDFVRYALLDLEREPAEQDFADASIDVIVASNVLHATRNVHTTLQRLRKLLRPGGCLLLQEVTDYLAWFDITVALIEAWDIFDDGLRCNHPMLSTTQWQGLLEDAGFVRCDAFPEPGSAAEVLGQHIMLAGVSGQAVPGTAPTESPKRTWQSVPVPEPEGSGGDEVGSRLSNAAPVERTEILVDIVRTEVSRILRLPAAKPPSRDDRLMDLGLDSLMTLELRNRLEKVLGLGAPLSSTLVFDCPTIAAIARHLETCLFPEHVEAVEVPVEARQPLADAIATMSEEQAEALLFHKLQTL
jgi:SAM-dependent methyltransferase